MLQHEGHIFALGMVFEIGVEAVAPAGPDGIEDQCHTVVGKRQQPRNESVSHLRFGEALAVDPFLNDQQVPLLVVLLFAALFDPRKNARRILLLFVGSPAPWVHLTNGRGHRVAGYPPPRTVWESFYLAWYVNPLFRLQSTALRPIVGQAFGLTNTTMYELRFSPLTGGAPMKPFI